MQPLLPNWLNAAYEKTSFNANDQFTVYTGGTERMLITDSYIYFPNNSIIKFQLNYIDSQHMTCDIEKYTK